MVLFAIYGANDAAVVSFVWGIAHTCLHVVRRCYCRRVTAEPVDWSDPSFAIPVRLSFGGSLIRPEATGYGLIYFLEEMIKGNNDELKVRCAPVDTAANGGAGNHVRS